jgi:hypothetical protein
MVGCGETPVVGGSVSRLPQDLHFEESHGRVGQISKVGWPEIQAGLLARHFHDWQRVRPRPRGRDSGRRTGPVVGRYLVRVEEEDGVRPGLVLLLAWLRHCGTVPAGTEQVLTKKPGRRKERLREWQSGERGRLPLYPSKRQIPAKTH